MLDLQGRNLVIPKPTRGEKFIHKMMGARKQKDGTYTLPANSLNVLRLVDNFGEGILDGSPAEVRWLAEKPWGFVGWAPHEYRYNEKNWKPFDELYEFQKQTVDYLVNNPHGAGLTILTPGLGKSAVAITAARMLGYRRVLVLSPPTLGPAWISELSRWWPGDTPSVRRGTRQDRTPGDEWTIAHSEVLRELILKDEDGQIITDNWSTNPRVVKQWVEQGPTKLNPKTHKPEKVRKRIYRLRRSYMLDFDLIIVDESILYKTRERVRTEILETLAKHADCDVWELSGFPTTKGRQDLYTQLKIMDPKAFSSYWRFVEFMCIVDKEGWGWTIEEDNPAVDPEHYLRDYIIVFSQEDVLPELPEYIPWRLPVEASPEQKKALDEMMEEWKTELEQQEGPVEAANLLARTTRLAQITSNLGAVPKPSGKGFHKANSSKEELLVELIKNDQIETPLLVWVWFVETTELLAKRLKKEFKHLRIEFVHGNVPDKDKDQFIAEFKKGDIDVLVLQQGIGKYGHTFTLTRTVFYHDRAYDLDAWVQSLRRVRRIGLEHRPVLVIPELENSFDQMVEDYLEERLPSAAELTRSDLLGLLGRALDDGE